MNDLPKRKSSHLWVKFLLFILIISGFLSACNLPWRSAKETATEPGEIAIREATLEPTSEPRLDLPPALVEVSPVSGSTISLNQPILLYFNQPMDKGSVEAAIHFEPRVNGSFSWQDDQVLTFKPDKNLVENTDLNLVINTSAQAANKKGLLAPIELNYQTVDQLQVLQVMPGDNSKDVDPESVLFVTFNQPVVPLGKNSAEPPAFSIFPEVAGKGKWLNTSTYVFTPDPSMAGGTTYTLTLNELLKAVSGSGFGSQTLEYTFETTTPRVIEALPLESDLLPLDGPIEVRFNIRMEPTSVEENFSLTTTNGTVVEGSFEWQENLQGFSFVPDELLDRNTRFVLQIGQGAQSYGGIPMEVPFETNRTTYPAFNVSPSSLPTFSSYYGQYGQYEIQLTTPVSREDFKDHVSINPEVASEGWYLSGDESLLSINGYFKPDTEYTVRLDVSLRDQWRTPLGQTLTYSFITPSAEPSLTIAAGYTSYNLIFVPEAASEITLQATNINTVTFEIAPISINDLLTLVHPDNYDYRQMFLPANLEVITHDLQLTRNLNQAVSLQLAFQGEPLAPGVYFLGITSADLIEDGQQVYQKYYLVVSDNHLVMKVSPEQTFVWATNLIDYSPLANIPVTVYNTDGNLLASGETDRNGFFTRDISRFEDPYASFLTVLGEPGEGNFGFSISTWNQGYALYEMGINQNSLPEQTQAYIYTDRPIYRPGDTLYFKAVVFSRENGLPVSSGLSTVDVSVNGDPGMSGIPVNIYSRELSLSQFGTISDSLQIPEDAKPGSFHIGLSLEDKFIESLYFDVAMYRKPEIELGLELASDEILAGDALNSSFTANYYFGLPVGDQSFSWVLFRDEANFELPGYQVGPRNTDWLMPRMPGYMDFGIVVKRGEGLTDADGRSEIRLSESDMALNDVQAGSMQKLNLELTVTDETNLPVTYRESAVVHPETFYIGVKPEAYVGAANTPINFSVITVDWDKEALGQIALEAFFEAIEWEIEETGSLEMPYRYVEQKTLIDTTNPITGDDGLSRVAFTPSEPGTYQLTLKSGNAVTEVLVWVTGEGSPVWPMMTQNLIELTADAASYVDGDDASIFFPNPFTDGAKALVTIERGKVIESMVIDVDGAGHNITIPITEESIPNIYLSVMLFGKDENGNPDFRQGVYNIEVTPISKQLNVEVILDPEKTAPGEFVSAKLVITDQNGDPVQGEFSVAVVDKAVLALVEANSPPILDAFYSPQPLQVQTAFSLKTYAIQLALSSQTGIGGGGGGDMAAVPAIREDFPDTAIWEGQIVTGADGTAQLEIPLPDSLTTWVVDVRGLTEDFAVGQAEAEIVTQKELMIRPVTPRFLVDGDRVELGAVVHNNTAETMDVAVSLLGSGFSFEDGTSQNRDVIIESGGNMRINWWCKIESVEKVDLVFQAVSGDLVDAAKPVWGDLQVLRYAMPETTSTAGQLENGGQVLELVSLPISETPSSGSLTLTLIPSLTAEILEGLEALETSKYSDNLSILSRMLANISTYQSLESLGIDAPQLETDLSTLVSESLHTLLDSQKLDGGWSWWGGSDMSMGTSDPFITAYILIGLQEARKAGYEVGEYYIELAEDFLASHLMTPGNIEQIWELDRLAFQIYALRDSNTGLSGTINAVYDRRSDLSPWSLGLFTLALDEYEGSSERVNTLLGDLEATAVRSETGVHWESKIQSWMLPGSPMFNTSIGVLTLSKLDPASTSLPLALRYLMSNKKIEVSEGSAFESAWVLMAATAALKGTGDYQADYAFQAILNDRLFAEGENVSSSIQATTSILDLFPDSPNALSIKRDEGPGTLYYRLDLQTYKPAVDAEPINKGISLERAFYLSGRKCPGGEDCTPINEIVLEPDNPAQLITVAITLNLSNDMVNFVLEDTIPSGTEILNREFLTSQTVQVDPADPYEPRAPFEDGWGWWYFNAPQIYDDHILWTADYVPAGTYLLTYELIPYQRGDFQVLPAHAWMYFYPEVQGTSAGRLFSIR